ncbi:MAG: Bpu10I family restriction endonuclease [Chloroflexi bacterium]|nr:Bpu10I family restriction endonuclease [Chloroflexota bacterium]
MKATPHLDKLNAAILNPKAANDVALLGEAKTHYEAFIDSLDHLTSTGKDRVNELVSLLNHYKDTLEVDLIMQRGSPFLKRQKGQLKLDNSVIEEFLIHLVCPEVVPGVENAKFVTGPQNAFMSLSFRPSSFLQLDKRPEPIIKTKDQDFVIGTQIHYRMAPTGEFRRSDTKSGSFVLAVLAAEVKVNLDKTMFQEATGTAGRLKMGCPVAKYFLLAEFLDMIPEDPRLTDIDNVFLLRKTRRLPVDKRDDVKSVEGQHKEHPISADVVWRFVEEIQAFVNQAWYDPEEALKRGSFV